MGTFLFATNEMHWCQENEYIICGYWIGVCDM